MRKYAAVIYDAHNVIVRVEERPTEERAQKAGEFWTRFDGWYRVVKDEEVELSKAMINL